jgi:flagella basal body P-ring formation protein FlgA
VEKTLLLLRWLLAPAAVMALAWLQDARAAEPESPFADQVRHLVMDKVADKAATPGQPRVEVIVGQLDPRLRLAPCEQIQPFIPTGARLWGRTRVGLKCVKGVSPWNVYLPVTVNVYGQALVATAALPVGHVLSTSDFRQAEVNLTEDLVNPAITDPSVLAGRSLQRPVSPGQSLRQNSLKTRQWFAAGDVVQIRAIGTGFAVAGSGEAVTAGLEGSPARIKMETGRIVSGMPVAEKQVEITL